MARMQYLLPTLLVRFSLQEWRHHPWRHAAALLAVMLGVALAYSVHLINSSALDEFSSAARAVSGQADLELRPAPGPQTTFDEAWLARLTAHPDVAIASPVLDISTFATGAAGRRVPLRVMGVDVLQIARIAPQLLPMPKDTSDRFAVFAPSQVFLNPSAQAALAGDTLQLQQGLQGKAVRVAGTVSTPGAPLAVMDIAAAQDLFGQDSQLGQLSRIDLRLRAGVDINRFARQMQATMTSPGAPRLERPDDAQARLGALSLAYRVNLTVLALVALFTGGFLVYSVVSLGVARRTPQFALLGVLGLTGTQGMALVLMESALLGLIGSVAGLALGTALAATALQLLGGDLGGGYFSGAAPSLQWHAWGALAYGSSGVLMATAGAWAPARQVQQLPLAPTLKGLGGAHTGALHGAWGAGLLLLGVALALLPAIGGVPVAAYLSVAALLLGGILSLPWLIALTLDRLAPLVQRRALPLLALERARRVRESAAVAVSGVVAALSLAVALTVMVASFRQSVIEWLDGVLPADLYVRTSRGGAANDTAFLEPQLVGAAQRIPGVQRVVAQRSMAVQLSATAPSASLVVRPLRGENGNPSLPLVAEALPVPSGRIGVYISEAVRDLYGAQPGGDFAALSAWFRAAAPEGQAQAAPFFIAGVFRDYARQFGTIAIDSADFSLMVQDSRVNDLALWLAPGADLNAVQDALRALTPDPAMLEFGSAQEIRATSLKIFDRSFAVTYWLQAVAIAIGLFGVAASFSAQVLARRKEFGLLAHLGFTRRQILKVVALEGLAWTTLGALAGLLLGLAVAVVLVHVVNPQSFHWTMELYLPWLRLSALAAVVVASGTLTAWLTGRAAASSDAVMAVKEDW